MEYPTLCPVLLFPGEVVDAIIDFLHSNRVALTQCSSVCRSWLPSARYHLFERVILHGSNIDTYLALRMSPFCTFPPYIQHLTLECWRNFTASENLSDELIRHRFGGLSSVKSIEILGTVWCELFEAAPGSFFACFPDLKHLEICEVYVEPLDGLCQFATTFPLLRSLSLYDVGWDVTELDLSRIGIDHPPPPLLESLRLRGCYTRDILNWLLVQQPIAPVAVLDLGNVRPADAHSIGVYLRKLGPILRHLEFGFEGIDTGGDAEELYSEVDLRCNAYLSTIHVNCLDLRDVGHLSSANEWLPLILKQITSLVLEEITLHIQLTRICELDSTDFNYDWDAYDEFIAGHHHIKRLLIVLDAPVETKVAEEEVGMRLPHSQKKGILRVTVLNES